MPDDLADDAQLEPGATAPGSSSGTAERSSPMGRNLDGIDIALLNELQINASRSIKQLSVKVSASPATVHRRREELRSDGIISGIVATVDQRAAGRPLNFVVAVETETSRSEELEALRNWIKIEPAFQQAYAMTGSPDLLLIITARTSNEFGALIARFQRENPVVKRAVPHLALETLKQSLFIPLSRN